MCTVLFTGCEVSVDDESGQTVACDLTARIKGFRTQHESNTIQHDTTLYRIGRRSRGLNNYKRKV